MVLQTSQKLECSYNQTRVSNKKGQTTDTGNNIYEISESLRQVKHLDTKDHLLYYSIYIKF